MVVLPVAALFLEISRNEMAKAKVMIVEQPDLDRGLKHQPAPRQAEVPALGEVVRWTPKFGPGAKL
jgi:hypothetical protein